jgi:hydrogenase-4 component F
MSAIIIALAVLPAAAIVVSAVAGHRVAAAATGAAGAASLGLAVVLAGQVPGRTITAGGVLRADSLSAVFELSTALLYLLTALYAVGYLAPEARAARRAAGTKGGETEAAAFARYSRRFYAGVNLFAWAMLCAPLVSGLALLWVAIEITTVVSALLVALDGTERAAEAAWKYVLIASCGLGIALLATIFMYYAGTHVLGQSYDLAFGPLVRAAAHLPATPVRLAFALAVLGFGTKVGLAPVHTWLPDAHAEAPTPVSALLSGALLSVSFYAILRYYQVAAGTLGPRFPQLVLLVFGVASLLIAALYVLDQQDIKRLLAYSSVEHMGILAIGVSFGAPLALAGVLLHVLAHAAAKGNAFMSAGVLVRSYRTTSLARIRGALDRLPWSGPLFLISVLALSAMPPFGIFRSEFEILAGGLGAARYAGAVILVALVTVAFLGLGGLATRILLPGAPHDRRAPSGAGAGPAGRAGAGGPGPVIGTVIDSKPTTNNILYGPGPGRSGPVAADPGWATDGAPAVAAVAGPGAAIDPAAGDPQAADPDVRRAEPSAWMVVPVVLGTGVLLWLGVHPPGALTSLLAHAAALLSGRP